MELMYSSTRNDKVKLTASQAILKGLADDGGLFVPERIPALDVPMDTLADMSYQETAYEVMSRFFTDFTEDELKDCIKKAYDSKFDTPEIAPLVDADGAYYLELFHGPTIAFKDMALSILPHLLITSARKNQVKNDIVILTATSGDTGKAALAGFADVEGTKIVVFYPKNGVSPIQEKQMITQKGANTCVVGIHGNFDQAQTGVKKMFNDTALEAELDVAGYQFSSANSINIGRLIPQVAYYVYAWYMTIYGSKIANIEFEAWQHGPVCRRLYNQYRCYGWNIIPPYRGFVLADDEKIRFIQGVLSIYGDYSADELERMTHNELPWIEARTAQVMDAVISDAAIQKYYSEQIIIKDKIMSFM